MNKNDAQEKVLQIYIGRKFRGRFTKSHKPQTSIAFDDNVAKATFDWCDGRFQPKGGNDLWQRKEEIWEF